MRFAQVYSFYVVFSRRVSETGVLQEREEPLRFLPSGPLRT